MSARYRDISTEARADLDAEGPLRRWARRKREVARETKTADEARAREELRDASEAAGEARESADDTPAPAVAEEKVLTDADMPSLDSLGEDSDYSGFLSPGVSEALRRRALRKLFSSAVFNVPDGLDDYDDDFTSFAALGDIVTADMKHQAEMEAERAQRAQARAEPAAGIEDERREAGDERIADAGDEAANPAEADPGGGAESSEPVSLAGAEPIGPAAAADTAAMTSPGNPPALTAPAPPDAITKEDAAGDAELAEPPVSKCADAPGKAGHAERQGG